jgi:hypothetical protein
MPTSSPCCRRPRPHRGDRGFGVALLVTLALLALAGDALAKAESRPGGSVLRFASLDRDGGASSTRSALDALGAEVRLRTSIETARRSATAALDKDDVFAFPLLFWAANTAPIARGDAELARLREHLTHGGLLWVDDATQTGPSAQVDAEVRELVRRLFGRPLVRVPTNDVLYRSFYRLAAPVGRRADIRALEGVKVGGRWALLYFRDDLLGAFMRSRTGGPALPVVPGGEAQREQAFRLGINLAMYAVCLDYKDDHGHVEALLRQRRGGRRGGR